MNFQTLIKQELETARNELDDFIQNETNLVLIDKASEIISNAIVAKNKIMSCGNGGSHCDAMHFSEELSGRYRENRKPLPAFAISDPSYMSCVSNDFGYDFVFSRSVEALGNPGDVLLAISTSGQSESIINAALKAKEKGMKTIVLTGKDGGKLKGLSDVEICVPHFGYADRIQEIHIKIIHVLILLVEKRVIEV
jgi:D-sedoheptulose 7-phosphate isomerase